MLYRWMHLARERECFEKPPEAIEQWSMENVAICAARQKEILDNAAVMLKPGGVIVYSTCTFSKEENEDVIEYFLERHPDFTLEEMERFWPHKVDGEGHFVAKLVRRGSVNELGGGIMMYARIAVIK